MAKITLAATTLTAIPGAVGRKGLILLLQSGDAVYGFAKAGLNTVSVAGATDAGIPLVVDEPLPMIAEMSSKAFAQKVLIYSTAGGTLTYQEIF